MEVILSVCLLVLLMLENANGWVCTTQVGKVYCHRGSQCAMQFSVHVTVPETFSLKFYNGIDFGSIFYSGGNVEPNEFPGTTLIGDANGKITLTLLNVQTSNAGTYYVESLKSDQVQCFTLFIPGTPETPTVSKNKDPAVGDNVTLTCNSNSTTIPSNHSWTLSYNWQEDTVNNPIRDRYAYTQANKHLTISNVVTNDSLLKFSCKATESNSSLSSTWSRTFGFDVLYGPDTACQEVQSHIEFTEGQIASIICSSECFPNCSYTWSNASGFLSSGKVLSLGEIQRNQAGNYTFMSSNIAAGYKKTHQRTFTVTVKYAPVVEAWFSSSDHSESSDLTLFCKGIGVPAFYNYTGLTQTVGGVAVPNVNSALQGNVTNSSIHFPELRLQDTGNYTCKMNNGIQDLNGKLDQTSSVELLVEVKPKVLLNSLIFVGAEGGSVTVVIPFYCHPAVKTVKYIRSDKTVITNSSEYKMSLLRSTVHDTFYSKNVSLDGYLTLMTISTLKQTDFGSYSLIIENDRGRTEVLLLVVAESIPSLPKHFGLLQSFAKPSLVWEGGFNGGHKQTFAIEVSVPDSGHWENFISILEHEEHYKLNDTFYTVTITGLQPGTYTARLIAKNFFGESKPLNLNDTFIIASDPPQTDSQPQVIGAAVGGAVSVAVAVIVVSAVIFVWKRRATNTEKKANLPCKSGTALQNDSSKEDAVKTENPMYVPVGPERQTVNAEYALPNKKKTDDINNVVKKPKAAKKEKGKEMKPTPPAGGHKYGNAPEKSVGGNVYGNAAFVDFTYEEPDVTPKTSKTNVNKEGLVYADMAFNKSSMGHKELVIQNLDDRTPYAEVDFQRYAQPLSNSDFEE